jgi:hypothetical protein
LITWSGVPFGVWVAVLVGVSVDSCVEVAVAVVVAVAVLVAVDVAVCVSVAVAVCVGGTVEVDVGVPDVPHGPKLGDFVVVPVIPLLACLTSILIEFASDGTPEVRSIENA